MIDGGRYPAKAIAGEDFIVSADIVRHGHDELGAVLRIKAPGAEWSETAMTHVKDDRWAGRFRPTALGRHLYSIEAWFDAFATWRRDLAIKTKARRNVTVELAEGALLVEERLARAKGVPRSELEEWLSRLRSGSTSEIIRAALDKTLAALMLDMSQRGGATRLEPAPLIVDRERALFGSWYEFFPRSTGAGGAHGTFNTAAEVLPAIADMGFDVVYLPPIHPIGSTHRKGKNNALEARSSDVGSPWAIGSQAGGHDAIHPELGTVEDFEAFVTQARANNLEVALDLAIQCSPDHPWVHEHPEWFNHRPDGSIKHAENPPKKYEDIYPVNFDTEDAAALWAELLRIVRLWIDRGVTIFRVDNPHTKPLPFWEWLIDSIRADRPDILFLAEAFTEPPMMKALSKLGFTQSYTYFTWKNTKREIISYLKELTETDMRYYFRPNFFVNTPDILHSYLQKGGPPAFEVRLALAATLSPTYGIYAGFEFFENTPAGERTEEYLNSEKFELRPRPIGEDRDLVPFVRKLNDLRRSHPALQRLDNLRFLPTADPQVVAYLKEHEGDLVLVAVNLDPTSVRQALVRAPSASKASPAWRDLVDGREVIVSDDQLALTLDPQDKPVRLLTPART